MILDPSNGLIVKKCQLKDVEQGNLNMLLFLELISNLKELLILIKKFLLLVALMDKQELGQLISIIQERKNGHKDQI